MRRSLVLISLRQQGGCQCLSFFIVEVSHSTFSEAFPVVETREFCRNFALVKCGTCPDGEQRQVRHHAACRQRTPSGTTKREHSKASATGTVFITLRLVGKGKVQELLNVLLLFQVRFGVSSTPGGAISKHE